MAETVERAGLAAGGQVYKLTPAGAMTVLHNFTGGTDGCNLAAAPIAGRERDILRNHAKRD